MDALSLRALLDGHERERYEALVAPDDRARFASARVLAKILAAQQIGSAPDDVVFAVRCQHCGGDHGKPRLASNASGVELSISHSHQRVVVAMTADAPVGVDIEPVRPVGDLTSVAGLVLSATERSVFDAIAPARRVEALLTYWVRKEAVLKATGHGLLLPLSTLTVSDLDQPPTLVRWDADATAPAAVALAVLAVGAEYVGCVATLAGGPLRLDVVDATETLRRTASAPRSGRSYRRSGG